MCPPRILAGSLAAGSIGTRATDVRQRLHMQSGAFVRKAGEDNSGHPGRRGQRFDRGRDRDISRSVGGETVDAGGNGGKRKRRKRLGAAKVAAPSIEKHPPLGFSAVCSATTTAGRIVDTARAATAAPK